MRALNKGRVGVETARFGRLRISGAKDEAVDGCGKRRQLYKLRRNIVGIQRQVRRALSCAPRAGDRNKALQFHKASVTFKPIVENGCKTPTRDARCRPVPISSPDNHTPIAA